MARRGVDKNFITAEYSRKIGPVSPFFEDPGHAQHCIDKPSPPGYEIRSMSALDFVGFGLWAAMIALALCVALKVKGFSYADTQVPFYILFVLALVFFRWTLLSTNKEYVEDESFFLAEAMKYETDFLPWRSVDGNTTGPLDAWAIMWPPLVGLPLNYCTERATGIILIILTVIFTQRFVRQALDPEWSLALILPLATMYCFVWDRGLASYTSQDVPIALLAALAWVGFASTKNPTTLRAFLIGLITGAIPFAKLQAAPIAAVMTTVIFISWILRGYREALPRRVVGIALWVGIASIFIVPAAILIPVAVGGALYDFWIRYPWLNLAYGAPRASPFIQFTEILRNGIQISAYFIGMAMGTLAFGLTIRFLPGLKKRAQFPIEASVALAAICGISWYAVIRSGFPSEGYLFFLALPALYLMCFALTEFDSRLRLAEHYSMTRRLVICQAAFISIFPQLFVSLIWSIPNLETQEYTFENNFETNFGANAVVLPIVQLLEKYRKPGDRLTVWGQRPALYVYSQLIPGNRDITSAEVLSTDNHQIGMLQWNKSNYFKSVFVRDLKEIKPRFFVDVSRLNRRPEWEANPEQTDATAVPGLAEVLKSDYGEIETLTDASKQPYARIYARRDH